MRLNLDVVTQLCELCLQAQEDGVEGLDLYVIAQLSVPERPFQGGFLSAEKEEEERVNVLTASSRNAEPMSTKLLWET